MIESSIDRTVLDRRGVVDEADILEGPAEVALVVGHRSALQRPLHPEVPFADASGVIALRLEKTRERHATFRDQGQRKAPENTALELCAPVVASGQERVTRRRADSRGSVPVGEAHPLGGEPVEVRRRDLGVRVVAAHVTIAEVVGEDDDDVGLIGGRKREASTEGTEEDGEKAVVHGMGVVKKLSSIRDSNADSFADIRAHSR